MSAARLTAFAILAAVVVSLFGISTADAGTTIHWQTWWGAATSSKGTFLLRSTPPVRGSETHSALVTTKRMWGDQTFSVRTTTLSQLRTGADPNPWEVGWVLFHFRDLSNYYWFMVKPTGWELGKKQGSDTQIFLASGTSPTLVVGRQSVVRIEVRGARIHVSVDGAEVVDYTDPNPLPSGSVGLYEEDSRASFGSLNFTA